MNKNLKNRFGTTLLAVLMAVGFTTHTLGQASVANYTFSSATNGSLVDMTGSTDLLATGTYRDDVASTVTTFPSNFTFVFMGQLYSQFSANSNGQLRFGSAAISGTQQNPSSGVAVLAAIGGDNAIQTTGKVHYLLSGVAPNRTFTVEWNDLRIPFSSTPGTGSVVQVILNESTGVIEYRYGNVFNNSTSITRTFFLANGVASATTSKYINLTGPAESNTGTAINNSLTNNAVVTGLNSSSNGSRTVFSFTPAAQPSAPTNLNFTGVGGSVITANWTDNASNETGYLVERSTDGTTFTVVTTTAANATTSNLTGLTPSTNYTIRIRAINEGAISTALTSTQSTAAVVTYVWNQTGTADFATAGNWTPSRSSNDPTDILEFNNGATTTATGVTTQTISRLLISGNSSVTLQSGATATLTLAGASGTDLDVASGSTLILGSTNTFNLTHAGSAGNTATIAGTLTVNASNTYTTSSSANVITTVTGIVNNSGTVSGATASLLFNSGSSYNHNFTTTSGTVPTATWNSASTVSFTTYTSNSSAPGGIGQTFGNVSWNCTSQTGNINFDNSSFGVTGTFTLSSTNTGSVRLTGATSRTISLNNVTITGGTLDFASSSGTLTMRVFGTFNQSGGTITESSSGVGVIEFADTLGTSQNVTLGTISNTFRYIVSDVQGINLTGTMTIATNGSLIINTVAATPINGGTLTFGTAPTTLQYGNATSNMASLTPTAAIFPATNGPSNLTINNANGISLGFNRTVTTLTMTSGNINLGGNTLTLGTAATTAGTLSYSSGLIQGGTFTRWFPTTGLPTTASTSIGYFPIGHNGNNRQVQLFFSAATALSTGGTISVTHNNVAGTTAITGFTDGAITVDRRTNSNWVIATANGIAATGTISMAVRGDNAGSPTTIADLRLIRATDAVGTSSNGTGSSAAPVANRTAVSLSDLASTFYLGSTSANLATVYTATSTGNWGDNATWDIGTPPTSDGLAIINAGVTVTLAGTTTPYNCMNLTVNGTLTANANTLTIGGTSGNGLTVTSGGTVNVGGGTIVIGPANGSNRTLGVSGTMTVSNGTVEINGNLNIASGANFTQSGGNIKVDGNKAGDASASVASGTAIVQINSHLLTLSGGTLTIVDPHANSTASNTFAFNTSSGHVNADTSHTLRLGDGTSSDTSANSTNGFRITTFVSSSRIYFGTLTLDCGTGTNRHVTTQYSFGVNNFNINANSEYRQTSDLYVAGNLVNNGTLVSTATIIMAKFLSGSTSASDQAQSISGSGSFVNSSSSSTANISSLTINNSSTGVTLNVPIRVSGSLTLTRGKLNTTSTNILSLGTTTAAGTLSGTNDTSFVNGPFVRTFAASRTASGTYTNVTLFPTGKGSVYAPIFVDPSTNSGGAVEISAEFFASHSGTAGSGVSNLSTVNWSTSATAGSANLTNVFGRVSHSGVDSSKKLLHASTANGTYNGTPGGSLASGSDKTVTTSAAIAAADILGFYAYGNLTPCTAPTNAATNFVTSLLTTTTFTGSFTAASGSPTGYLVVRYTTAQTPVDPTDGVVYTGSALGGTVVANLTASPFSFTQTGLVAGTQYDYRVYSYNNSGCAGPAYLTSSRLNASVTTCATATVAPGTPVASNRATTSMTIRFTNSTTASSTYIADVATNSGFTTFLSGYQGFDLGTDTSFNLSGLTAATTYYVRVRAKSSNCFSSFSSTLTTSTLCAPISTFPYTQNFTTFLPNICWSQGKTGNLTTGPSTTGSSSWTADGYLNNGTTGAARMNVFGSADMDWLISEEFALPAGNNRLKYKIGATQYDATTAPTTAWESDDSIYVAVNISGNANWTVVKTYGNTNVPSHLGQTDSVDLSDYENNTIKIAFITVEGITNGSADVDVHLDDVEVLSLGVNTWNGTGLWSNVSNWSLGIEPASGRSAIIASGTATTGANTNVKALTINSGAAVIVDAGHIMTITGGITNNGTLTVKSTSASSYGQLMVSGTTSGSGTARFERAVTGTTAGWRLISSPTNANFNSFGPSPVFVGPANILTLNTASPNAWDSVSSVGTTTVGTGRGYLVYLGNGGVNNNSASHTFNLSGSTLNTTNTTVAGLSNGDGTSTFGWSVVGNPFGTNLTWDTTANTRTNIDNAYYVWNATSGGGSGAYASYVSGVSNPGGALTNYIAPMQGFLVKANAASPVLTFAAGSRNTGMNNTQLRTSNLFDVLRLRAAEVNGSRWDEATFVSRSGATVGFESEYDAFKLMNFDATAPNLFSKATSGESLSINAFAEITGPVSIPVHFVAGTNGNYSITLDAAQLGNQHTVTLEDLKTGARHDMRSGAYNFAHLQSNTNDRFVLHLNASTVSVNNHSENPIHVYTYNNHLYVTGLAAGELVKSLRVLDITGKVVVNETALHADEVRERPLQLPAGTYMIQVVTDLGIKNVKVILGM